MDKQAYGEEECGQKETDRNCHRGNYKEAELVGRRESKRKDDSWNERQNGRETGAWKYTYAKMHRATDIYVIEKETKWEREKRKKQCDLE